MAELVSHAEEELRRREEEALEGSLRVKERQAEATWALRRAIEAAQRSKGENLAELRQAIKAAQEVSADPQLRAKARRLLATFERELEMSQQFESSLKKLCDRLQECYEEGLLVKSPRVEAQQQLEEQRLMTSIRQEASEAERVGIFVKNRASALKLVAKIERKHRDATAEVQRLRKMLEVDDATQLEERLQVAKDTGLTVGPRAARVVDEVQERISRLAQKEHQEQWFQSELRTAAENGDAARLQVLFTQAHTLGFVVPPAMVSFLHELEEASPSRRHQEALAGAKAQSERRKDFALRQQQNVEKAVAEAEEQPTTATIDIATKAVLAAKQGMVPKAIMNVLEKRLAKVEVEHRPRIAAEEKLQNLLTQAEDPDAYNDPVFLEACKVDQLRTLLEEAKSRAADEVLVEEAEEVLKRSVEMQQKRRQAEEQLRRARAGAVQSWSHQRVESLSTAVETCKQHGVLTMMAKLELDKMLEQQVQREAAQAELAEALKGSGAQARQRLQEAVRTAKSVGVSAEKLRAASIKLADMANDEHKCVLAAGDLRRTLLVLETEPWRLQQMVQTVKKIEPKTDELLKVLQYCEESLARVIQDRGAKREVLMELRDRLKRIQEGRAAGEPVTESLATLPMLLKRAKGAGAPEELLKEGARQLQLTRREACQRAVAEHRLRLALGANDLEELERAVRQVRALGVNYSGTGRGDRDELPLSARLMEAANSMLRQLHDASVKRQAAAAILHERILEPASHRSEHSAHAGLESHQATDTRTTLVAGILKEARHTGVAQTLIEQARLKIRQRRRQRQEEKIACDQLERALSKKETPDHEVIRYLQKARRLQKTSE